MYLSCPQPRHVNISATHSPCVECCEGYSNRLLITKLVITSMLFRLPWKADDHQSVVMATWDRLKFIRMLWPIQGKADATWMDCMARGVC